MENLQGKPISTAYGPAVISNYDQKKGKFLVEYTGQQAIGWLTENEFELV